MGTVGVPDILSGTTAGQPTVTATFSGAIALSDPGAYTLEIKGGDFTGFNETGNHTAPDNLVISGITNSGSGLVITDIVCDKEAGSLSLTWNSTPGTLYAVKVSTDIMDWDADLDDGIEGRDEETITAVFNLADVNLDEVEKAFFRVEIQPAG